MVGAGPDRGLDRLPWRRADPRRARPATLALLGVALCGGVLVFLVATDVFPYHSSNHDEGVYLQQAAMLLEGRLWLTTPHPEAFRPWFFVRDGHRLYPKYTPVPAATFAPALAVGVPRLALAGVAAGNAALVGALASAAFDRRTGVLAVCLLVASPLYLVTSSVFLPYAPTFLLECTFAYAYVRTLRAGTLRRGTSRGAHRRGTLRRPGLGWALLGGCAIGLAFFARPYTAVLFAAPFLVHAGYRLVRAGRRWRAEARAGDDSADGQAPGAPTVARSRTLRTLVARYAAVAAAGLLFVGVTLAYNEVVTGSALRFPYEAFAPLDGLGFGRRRLLGHAVEYTPDLAVRANARVLAAFATDWFAAGPLGTAAAAVGAGWFLARVAGGPSWPRRGADEATGGTGAPPSPGLSDRELRALLLGVTCSVALGNLYFWGNLNLLGDLSTPGDGFVARFGPLYHFDLLLPLSAFAAAGVLGVARGVRGWLLERYSRRAVRAAAVVALLLAAPPVAVAEWGALGPPVETNAAYTEKYERAYAPLEPAPPGDALVFVPPTYGEWLNHPFQWLRNGGSLRGETVYALDRSPRANLALVEDYGGRALYRYTYRGSWGVDPDRRVSPALQRLAVREGTDHRVRTTVGVVANANHASVRLSTPEGATGYVVENVSRETVAVEWGVGPDTAWLANGSDGGDDAEDRVALPAESGEVALAVTFAQPGGATVTYRQELAVDPGEDGRVRVVWPPVERVCRLSTDCGHEGTYLAGLPPESYVAGVSMETAVRTTGAANDTTGARAVRTATVAGGAPRDRP